MSMNEAFKKIVSEMVFSPNENQCFCKNAKLEDFQKRGYLNGYDKQTQTYRIVWISKHTKCEKFRISISDKKTKEEIKNA